MAEAGKVKSLRAIFEKNAAKPSSPVEFEKTRASVARHNLKYAARRASRTGQYLLTQRIKTAVIVKEQKVIQSDDTPPEWITFGDSEAFWLPELDEAIS